VTLSIPSIIEFAEDPQLCGLTLSPAQTTLLKAIYGLHLTPAERDLYKRCTGRERALAQPFLEATVVAGARSGKDSRIAAPIVCYEALFGGHEKHLARGERAVTCVVAQDFRATKVAFGYIRDYLTRSPLIAARVEDVQALEISLTNGVAISCFPCTLRSLRGWSIPCAIMDEVGFYRLEGSADSDIEVQTSVRRGMVAFPQPRLVKVGTPWLSSGVLYDDFQSAWGQDNPDILCWRAPSILMNPSLGHQLEREKRRDPERYSREYEAEFATDEESFLRPEWITACVVPGRGDLPPQDDVRYVGSYDPAGGGPDACTACVAHGESEGRIVIDAIRGWSRAGNAIAAVVRDAAALFARYRVRQVEGDQYGSGWLRGAFQDAGIAYELSLIHI